MTPNNNNGRSRTYTWQDPSPAAQAARKQTGLDFFNNMIQGQLPQPPIAKTLDFALTEADEGTAVFEIDCSEFHYNPLGTVHGGVIATLLDSAMSCAVHTLLPAGSGYTTVEMKVNFVRPILADTGPLRCIGTIVHGGRRIATAEGKLVDANGKLYAHGTTTCFIFSV
ncbi:PaaI family thioesterase [Candidatus Leptofilum sp.]|uniref:PaaI family thioesterase n=1 Tax=Candidatus Leptofilum sp. TaxID=3241576 RepID=UPI003B5A507E